MELLNVVVVELNNDFYLLIVELIAYTLKIMDLDPKDLIHYEPIREYDKMNHFQDY